MAIDMSKYAKMTEVERKLPIIFMIKYKLLYFKHFSILLY